MGQRILIVGNLARDHALAWKFAQSPRVEKIYVAPGNGGTAQVATNVAIAVSAYDQLIDFAVNNKVDLVYVSGDDQLGDGLVDRCQSAGLKAFGPFKAAAQIEASKAFAKDFMKRHDIPTAAYETFEKLADAEAYLETRFAPIVIKASGLAGGKGVVIAQSIEEAHKTVREIMQQKVFGAAGDKVIIEEYLHGPEVSIHAFSDGTAYSLFPPAQDHKPIGEGNTGPNTGGMGTLAPLPGVSSVLMKRIEETIVAPVIKGLRGEGKPYVGVLYPGIILTSDGPKALEFNARFGDPEAQSYVRILDTDLLGIIEACLDGSLQKLNVAWSNQTAVNIVLASGGYPRTYQTGKIITGIEQAESDPDVVVFQAGTKQQGDQLVTDGGRVLSVSATAANLDAALAKAYAAADKITFEGKTLRTDIGKAHDNTKLRDF